MGLLRLPTLFFRFLSFLSAMVVLVAAEGRPKLAMTWRATPSTGFAFALRGSVGANDYLPPT